MVEVPFLNRQHIKGVTDLIKDRIAVLMRARRKIKKLVMRQVAEHGRRNQ